MSDRLALALDGSTGICSVALVRMHQGADREGVHWTVAARRTEADGRAQAKVMLRLVDEMLEETGRGPRDLSAVVVGSGPGTFTGVRITVATARALSLALSVPVLGVGTLGALAAAAAAAESVAVSTGAPSAAAIGEGAARPDTGEGAPVDEGRYRLLVPVVDARRGQLFYGLYRSAVEAPGLGTRRWVRSTEFGVCDREALSGVVAAATSDRPKTDYHSETGGHDLGARAGSVLVVGEDAFAAGVPDGTVFRNTDVGAEWLLVGQERLDEPGSLPQGARLAPWLAEVFAAESGSTAPDLAVGSPGTPESVTPQYVRSPDADIHITKMRDPWTDGAGGR